MRIASTLPYRLVIIAAISLVLPLGGMNCPNNMTPMQPETPPPQVPPPPPQVLPPQPPVPPRPPEAPTANAGADQAVEEGSSVILDGSAGGGAATTIQWSQIGGPPVTMTDGSKLRAMFVAPIVSQQTPFTFKLAITNSGGAAEDQVVVTVRKKPLPPTANAGADQTVKGGRMATLDGSGSQGADLRFAWSQIEGPAAPLTNAATSRATVTVPVVEADTILKFELRVTDTRGQSASAVQTITAAPNPPPTAVITTSPASGIVFDASTSGDVNTSFSGSFSFDSHLSSDDEGIARRDWCYQAFDGAECIVSHAGDPYQLSGVPLGLHYVNLRVTDADNAAAQAQVPIEVVGRPRVSVIANGSNGIQTRKPSIVRVDMRLTDTRGNPVLTGVNSQSFEVSENNSRIDLTEVPTYVAAGDALPLRVMVIMDYSNSIKTSGTLPDLIRAVTEFIRSDSFSASHQMGLIEFNDSEGLNLVLGLTRLSTAGRDRLVASIPGENSLYNGVTRVWDAVDLALRNLTSGAPTGVSQAIVFLTDGNDNASSSQNAPQNLINRAKQSNIRLFPIGFGEVSDDNESLLEGMAEQTNGQYFAGKSGDELEKLFADIASQLRGQWSLTYRTPKRTDNVVNVDIDYLFRGLTRNGIGLSFNAALIYDPARQTQGDFDVSARDYDPINQTTTFTLSCKYMPLGIKSVTFALRNRNAAFALQAAGGFAQPSAKWRLDKSAQQGVDYYALVNENNLDANTNNDVTLPYAGFGDIGTITVPSINSIDVPRIGLGLVPSTWPPERTFKLHDDELETDDLANAQVQIRYVAPINVQAGPGPTALALIDANTDGVLDLLVGNRANAQPGMATIGYLAGVNGTNFAGRVDVRCGDTANAVASADFNGDELPDLALSHVYAAASAGVVTVVNAKAAGGFDDDAQNRRNFNLPLWTAASSASHMVVCDINADRKNDLVVAVSHGAGAAGEILVFSNKGRENSVWLGFADAIRLSAGGAEPGNVSVCDIDRDGDLDIVTCVRAANSIVVFQNSGNNSFAAAATPVMAMPTAIAVGDINSDGMWDIIVTYAGAARYTVVLNAGRNAQPGGGWLGFAPAVNVNHSAAILLPLLTDVDNDGDADLVGRMGGSTLFALPGNNDGTFAPLVTIPTMGALPGAPAQLLTGDMNRDGGMDMVITAPAQGVVSIIRNALVP